MKNLLTKLPRLLMLLALILSPQLTRAGLQIPYTPDGDTLHLWHFDDPTNYVNTLNTVTDAVPSGGITLTNFGLGAGPYTNIFLVTNGAAGNLKDCLFIPPADAGTQPNISHAFCGLGSALGNSFADTTSFRNSTSGAFTFEALVNIQGNIFSSSAGNGEWELFCGDNNGSGGLARGWQFRVQNAGTPILNCNFITASGGSAINFAANLPSSGLDAIATNQWYHVAVTYTGNAPTNGDLAGVMTFYWTFLDGNRTNASFLAAFTNSAAGTLGGTPIPAIGGSSRNTKGVGNAGSFQGFIDEVRVSSVARTPTTMIFTTNAVINPPTFTGGTQPPPSTFLGFGQALSLGTLVKGTLPITYQWQKTNSAAGGWTNVTGQTANTYSVASTTFNDAGFYRLIATNAAPSANSVTSSVALVTIGAKFSELFDTGWNTSGALDATLAGTADPHYKLAYSSDLNNLGPNPIVWNMSAYPIAASGGAFANIDGVSQWIGSQGNSYTSPNGQYVYRVTFLLDSVDITKPVTVLGTWWNNSLGTDILLNGKSTGNVGGAHNPIGGVGFSITNGFVAGLNTLDFVTTKDGNTGGGSYQESAVRVEFSSALGQALAPGVPVIAAQPLAQTVRDNQNGSGSTANFSVVALGRPPLAYQWWADGAPVVGATNRTLSLVSPDSTASPGTSFSVVVSNFSGSVTSSVAVLTLTTNQPPVVVNYTLTIYSNATLNFDLAQAYAAATDADGDPLTLAAYDGATTNGIGLALAGTMLTYVPDGYVGADQFTYTINDPFSSSVGLVNINVLPLVAPSVVSAALSGSHVVVSGSGGGAGGSFHVLSTTDLLTPLAAWTSAGSGVFDSNGNFSITNAITPGVPQSFYLIQVP